MEKIGSLLIEKGLRSVPEDTGQEDEQENLQGRRRNRSNRLERTRRHLDRWGRRGRGQPGMYWRGRGQPGRYWRGGMVMMGPEVVEERAEDILNDSGYFGDMDMFEDDMDGTVFSLFENNTQDLETITEEILD